MILGLRVAPATDTREVLKVDAANQRVSWRPLPATLFIAVAVNAAQRLVCARWRVYRGRRCINEGITLPERPSATARTVAEEYAASHPTLARGRLSTQLRIDPMDVFCNRILDRYLLGRLHATLVGWDLPYTCTRMARHSAPAARAFAGGWSESLFGHPRANGRGWDDGKGRPRLRFLQLTENVCIIGWAATARGTAQRLPARPLDLRNLIRAVTRAQDLSVIDACNLLGLAVPAAPTLVVAPSLSLEVLDALGSQLGAFGALLDVALAEVDAWHAIGVRLDPTRLYSPAGIATALVLANTTEREHDK